MDAILDYPQSGERFRSRATLSAQRGGPPDSRPLPAPRISGREELGWVERGRFQLAALEARRPEDMGEDDFADLQNAIGYLGSLLTRLEDEHRRRSAGPSDPS